MNKSLERLFRAGDRACDALVLAYDPSKALTVYCGRNLYIPSGHDVEEAFGVSLRKIFGRQDGEGCHWADAVKWPTIANRNKIEKRIHEDVWKVVSGDPDYQTIFDGYLSMSTGRFEHDWVYMKGDMWAFAPGKREEALNKFNRYWRSKEKEQWTQIHKFMREYTAKQYKEKSER